MIWTLLSIFLFGVLLGFAMGFRLNERLHRHQKEAQAWHASQIIKPEHLKQKVESEAEKN